MGFFNRRHKANTLRGMAEKAEAEAERAGVAAQEARATATQNRIEAARAEGEEIAAHLEKEAAEQDLRLAIIEVSKVRSSLDLAEKNRKRAVQVLDKATAKFTAVVGENEKGDDN